jgi:hypothetical protein
MNGRLAKNQKNQSSFYVPSFTSYPSTFQSRWAMPQFPVLSYFLPFLSLCLNISFYKFCKKNVVVESDIEKISVINKDFYFKWLFNFYLSAEDGTRASYMLGKCSVLSELYL